MVINKLLTDNGSQFTSRFTSTDKQARGNHAFDIVCTELGIEHRLAPARRPQTNGMAERINARISNLIAQTRFSCAAELELNAHAISLNLQSQHSTTALHHQTSIQALKSWCGNRPELFVKSVHEQTGLDTEPRPCVHNFTGRVWEPMSWNRPPCGCTVYVARPSLDMEQSCATLIEELIRRGYRVVPDPDAPVSNSSGAAVTAIDAALDESAVCVHLLGDPRGLPSEGAGSMVRLQLERTAAKALASAAQGPAQPRNFHRLIWAPRVIPRSLKNVHSRDPLTVLAEYMGPNPGAISSTGVCPGDKLDGNVLPEFSQFVLQHLEAVFGPTPLRTHVELGAQIYVQHDECDAVIAGQVTDGLRRSGFAPVLSPKESNAEERRHTHSNYLQSSEAVLLCWAYASPVWVRATVSELGQWRALGRSEPFTTRTVIALPPHTEDKEQLCRFAPGAPIDKVIDATSAPPVKPYVLELFLRELGGLVS